MILGDLHSPVPSYLRHDSMNRRDFLQLGLATAAGLSPVVHSFGESTPMATDPLLLHRFGVDYTPRKSQPRILSPIFPVTLMSRVKEGIEGIASGNVFG